MSGLKLQPELRRSKRANRVALALLVGMVLVLLASLAQGLSSHFFT
jgi:hypothetical protein